MCSNGTSLLHRIVHKKHLIAPVLLFQQPPRPVEIENRHAGTLYRKTPVRHITYPTDNITYHNPKQIIVTNKATDKTIHVTQKKIKSNATISALSLSSGNRVPFFLFISAPPLRPTKGRNRTTQRALLPQTWCKAASFRLSTLPSASVP